jgi:hypothetical protein
MQEDPFHGGSFQVSEFVGEVRSHVKPEASNLGGWRVAKPDNVSDGASLMSVVKEQGSRLQKDLDELKRLLAVNRALESDNADVVYVGGDMQRLLADTERNLESKMKLQTMLTVVLFYSAVAVTVPILIALFRGGT